MTSFSEYLSTLNDEYLRLHTTKEDLWWINKMGLSDDTDKAQQLASNAEIVVTHFIQDDTKLRELREFKKQEATLTADELIALDGWIAFFAANVIENETARALAEEIIDLEGKLQIARGGMGLGYIDPATGEKHIASTNQLSNMLISEKDEAVRKAAWEGLYTIGPFVLANGYIEIVRKRNQLATMCGYEDYYDYKVQRTEGFTKKKLFELLDDLEVRTRDANERAINNFVKEKGDSARAPWNFGFYRSGKTAEVQDPYHPFYLALDRWVRSFGAMNIKYRGATLTLDLIDRKGKYENGFMHGPVPSYFHNGTWNPARINFTANAIPNRIGSGIIALNTLFHEGGHAAHFSNVLMNSPCFSQEFAPTSVAYAETQSMFLDSIISDADWLTRYAKNESGETFPFELIERIITEGQPFIAMTIRSMLGVCYAEKAIYEMSEAELIPENIIKTLAEIEKRMYSLSASPRPILAVPHLLAGESSAYYHGYVLAEMAVQQTRTYFMEKYGYICDNPNIGPELENGYWKSGNSVPFMTLVENLTGKPFSADALVAESNRTVAEAITEAKRLVEHSHSSPQAKDHTDLAASIRVIHGNEEIAKFSNGDFAKANEKFETWVIAHYPKTAK